MEKISFIYIYEQDAKIGVRANTILIESAKERLTRKLPIEGVEGIVIFGNASPSSNCVRELLERDISLTWLSSSGKFFGRLESTKNVNIFRQRKQFAMGEDSKFSLELSKKFISAKIKNQITILRRYLRNRDADSVDKIIDNMAKILKKIDRADNKEVLMGDE